MTINRAIAIFALLSAAAPAAFGQSLVKTAALAQDQIGFVKSAMGITTRISFSETVKEIVCGDLYDPASGKGSFVVQRSDNDVFLKPVVSKGLSNLFVKTGESGEHVYSFDLTIVPVEQAYRILIVVKAAKNTSPQAQPGADAAQALTQARQQAADIVRAARQQAEQVTAQAEQRSAEAGRQAAERAEQEVALRFSRALITGLREAKIGNVRVFAKRAAITLDPRVLTFDGKTYLRYTIQNKASEELAYNALSLETGAGDNRRAVEVRMAQNKSDNRLKPGEMVTGVLVFDQAQVPYLDRLTLYLRGEENAEIARVVISQ
jgi:hypothetical protein